MENAYCNICLRFWSAENRNTFLVATCYHIFCEGCSNIVSESGICVICKELCKLKKLDATDPDSTHIFNDGAPVLKGAIKALEFHDHQRSRLKGLHKFVCEKHQKAKLYSNEKEFQIQRLKRELNMLEEKHESPKKMTDLFQTDGTAAPPHDIKEQELNMLEEKHESPKKMTDLFQTDGTAAPPHDIKEQ